MSPLEDSGSRDLRCQTGIAGLAAVVLFAAANGLWAFSQPALGAPASAVFDFYRSASTRIAVGAPISLLAAALLLVFGAGLRQVLREHEAQDLLATAAFGGFLLIVASGVGAETVNLAGATDAAGHDLTPQLARAFFEISFVLGYDAAGVGIAVVLLSCALIAWRSRSLMPTWAALACALLALAFLTPLSRWLVPVSLLLLAGVSLRLLRHPGGPPVAPAL